MKLAKIMKTPQFIFYFLAFAALLYSCGQSDQPYYEPGVSLELAKHRKKSLDSINYALQIKVPFEADAPLEGEEKISLHVTDLSKDLLLDFKVPEDYLQKVVVNSVEVEADLVNEHIIIDKADLILGKNEIALKFRVGESSLNRNKNYLYTLFVPERARTAFPCFDQPNLKATYQLTLDIPAQWEALANGSLGEEKIASDRKTLIFDKTRPISTYLFDFVVGEFEVVERSLGDRQMTMLHRETDILKVERNLDEIFKLHLVALEWLEGYTDIAYPFEKFAFALIPSFQYGGMEHPGAITYKAESLLLNENPSQNQLLRRASLIAHETAHMWFGDLVTMDWFNDVWMKEVFANFMAAKIVHPSFPEINHDLRFLLAHYPSAYAVDRTRGSHPIQQPLANLKDAGTLYGSIIYQKAPIVMRMLERLIGAEEFQSGIKQYLTDFSYGNATWDDLIGILDQLTEEDLSEWSELWIKTAGMPRVVPIIREKDDGSIRKFSIFQFDNAGEVYRPQDLAVTLVADDTAYQYDVKLRGQSINIDSAKGLHNASFIMANSAGYGYGYFPLGPQTRQRWLTAIETFDNPVHRGVGWLSLYESMLRRSISTEDYLKTVVRNIPLEKDPLIQQHMLNSMQTVFWKLINDEDRGINALKLEEVIWQQLIALDDSRLKRTYFNSYRSMVYSEEGRQRLFALWNKDLMIEGLTLSEADYTQLACALALRSWPEAETVLDQQVARINNQDRKERLEFIRPSLSADKSERDAFFTSLSKVENRHHESWVQAALGYIHHPLRASEAIDYITPTLKMLEEIQQTGDIFFPKRVLDNTFYGHSSDESVDAVRQFLYRNNHYPQNLKNKILQASDLTFRAQERLADRADSVKIVVFE